MSLAPAIRQRIESIISTDRVVLFMKGSRTFPQCGFSATVVQILDHYVPGGYQTVNVLSDPNIRQGIKDFSEWPTIPQLYIEGEFIGGCDIVREMHDSGDLGRRLGTPADVEPPTIEITDSAAAALREAMAGADAGDVVHLGVDGNWTHDMYLGPATPGAIEIESNGIKLCVAKAVARRLDGLVIRHEESAEGAGFRLDNPNQPAQVTPLSARELKAKLDAGEELRLVDVRSQKERDIARIDGSLLLDDEGAETLLGLPRDTVLVFQCHHGVRSRAAAEQFLAQGFTRVYNLTGGINAWSLEIDPDVPRY